MEINKKGRNLFRVLVQITRASGGIPPTVRELAEATDKGHYTVDKYINQLREAGRVGGGGYGRNRDMPVLGTALAVPRNIADMPDTIREKHVLVDLNCLARSLLYLNSSDHKVAVITNDVVSSDSLTIIRSLREYARVIQQPRPYSFFLAAVKPWQCSPDDLAVITENPAIIVAAVAFDSAVYLPEWLKK